MAHGPEPRASKSPRAQGECALHHIVLYFIVTNAPMLKMYIIYIHTVIRPSLVPTNDIGPYLGADAQKHLLVHAGVDGIELELEVLSHQPYVALYDDVVAVVLDLDSVEEFSFC